MRSFLVLALLLPACANGEAWLLEKNRVVKEAIDDAAETIDVYVANKRLVDVENRSSITIHNAFRFAEHGERKYSPHLGVKLHLPNLQEKLQLRFTSYDEDVKDRGINENRYQQAPTQRNYGTSLAIFEQLGSVKTEFRPRVEYNKELLTSYLFKFSSDAEHGALTVKPQLQLFARSDTGTGEFVALGLDYKLTSQDDVALINEQQYTDGDNTTRTNQGFRWLHVYDEIFSQEQAVIFESNNRPTYHLDRTVVSTTFRHRFRRNILHYSVTPYAAFAKFRKFRPATGLDLRLEIIF